MEEVRKTIHGIDFYFKRENESTDWDYIVGTENYVFAMHRGAERSWIIVDQVPVWIRELEVALSKVIAELIIE